MKPVVIRVAAAWILASALMVACNSQSYWASDPPASFNIVRATLSSNGQQYAPQDGGTPDGAAVPAVSLQVELEVEVTTSAGLWTIAITADGALAVASTDAGSYTASFTSADSKTPVILTVPVTIVQPAGTGFIHIQLGTERADYAFEIGAVNPAIVLCTQTTSGTCLPDATDGGDNGGGATDDGGIVVSENGSLETFSIAGASVDQLHNGDPFSIRISLPDGEDPIGSGVSWVGKVITDGVFALTSDGGTANSRAIEFVEGIQTVTVPAVVTAVGVGTVTATIGVGAPTTVSRIAVSSTQSVHEVRLIGYVGLGANNLVSVCSTRVAGAIRVQTTNDAGIVVPSEATLTVTSGGDCPVGYPSRADFLWTGYDPYTILTITDEVSTSTSISVIPTLGTTLAAQVTQSSSPSWVCEPPDAGAPPPADSGTGIDSGASASLCSGFATVFVNVQVFRGQPSGDASTSTTPAAGSRLGVQVPMNFQVSAGPVVTDVDGKATLQLVVPPATTSFPVVVSVDGKVTQVLTVQ